MLIWIMDKFEKCFLPLKARPVKRLAMAKPKDRKEKPCRKPLMIMGAVQAEKARLMKGFGSREHAKAAYIVFSMHYVICDAA